MTFETAGECTAFLEKYVIVAGVLIATALMALQLVILRIFQKFRDNINEDKPAPPRPINDYFMLFSSDSECLNGMEDYEEGLDSSSYLAPPTAEIMV